MAKAEEKHWEGARTFNGICGECKRGVQIKRILIKGVVRKLCLSCTEKALAPPAKKKSRAKKKAAG